MSAGNPLQQAAAKMGAATVSRMIDGRPISFRRAVCECCGASEEVRHKAEDWAGWQFEAKGWRGFGKRVTCPTCSRRGRKHTPVATPAPSTKLTMSDLFARWTPPATPTPAKDDAVKPIPKTTEPSREPTLDEAAAIFRKLDECFEDGRYLDGWSDKKIGEALGLPWAMVSKVRDKFRGPIKEDPVIAALRGEIELWMEMGAELKARLAKLAA